jgi:hypothetical protein
LFNEALNFKKIVPIIKNQAVNLQTIGRMKSQRVYQILVVFMLILPTRILAQQQMPLFAQKTPHILPRVLKTPRHFENNEIQASNHYKGDLLINNEPLRPLVPSALPFGTAMISTNFMIQNLPFFCKKEFLFEKTTSVPLRVRLGSLDYVNKLEGKENHWSVVPGN